MAVAQLDLDVFGDVEDDMFDPADGGVYISSTLSSK
jgi:hypothetical protein